MSYHRILKNKVRFKNDSIYKGHFAQAENAWNVMRNGERNGENGENGERRTANLLWGSTSASGLKKMKNVSSSDQLQQFHADSSNTSTVKLF